MAEPGPQFTDIDLNNRRQTFMRAPSCLYLFIHRSRMSGRLLNWTRSIQRLIATAFFVRRFQFVFGARRLCGQFCRLSRSRHSPQLH
ncbi:hypothetical protein SBA5_40023 [Candidatus Sulfotelmatomonas gaucii]|uniref:Uncharacterized protein n=1 Tax=Candidatus Sulfuritelmatomonas gaucii TaxID=2043161 RepID=A0A2N9LJR3_9BACT|nr:hypothetical protein SBA5_40023 [Candidatus Sulfotelmatomonas gaucii]